MYSEQYLYCHRQRAARLHFQSGGVTEGRALLICDNVSSPDLHKQGGALQTDLSAEAPHRSDILCSYSAGVRCLATAAVLVTFADKSDMRSINTFGHKST